MSRMISLVILIGLVVFLAIMFFEVMFEFLLPLFLAALLAVLFQPLFQRFDQLCRGRDHVAAALTTTAILLIVLVPVSLILFQGANDARKFFPKDKGTKLNRETFDRAVAQVNEHFELDFKPDDVFDTVKGKADEWLGPVAYKTPGYLGAFLVHAFVTILALYYFLADGQQLIDSIMGMVPLDPKYQQQLLTKFVEISRAVAGASLITALTQGVLLGIGYYFAGLDGLFLLVILTMLTSFIPMVGSALVWGSCCIWMAFSGEIGWAIGLAIWSAVVAVLVDNVLKPIILHGQANLHPLLALLSVLGGVQMLGPIGIFIGPMVVAFLQAGLNMLNLELEALRRSQLKPTAAPG